MSTARFLSTPRSFLKIISDATVNWSLIRPRARIKTVLSLNFSTNNSLLAIKSGKPFRIIEKKDGSTVKKKNVTEKISLIDAQGSRKYLYIEEAKKIAEHNNLTLVQEEDQNDKKKKVYRLVRTFDSELEELQLAEPEDSQSKSLKKKIKKFLLKTEVSSSDLNVKIKNILKIVQKGNAVVVTVLNNDTNKLGCILDKFREELSAAHILHKMEHRKTLVLIQIYPNSENKNENAEEKKTEN